MTMRLLTLLLAGFSLSFSAASSGVEISKTNFPDALFREFLLSQSYGADGVLTNEEIKGITKINVSDKGIVDMKGIEYFTALKTLDCSKNKLTTLDVSKNTKLTQFHCNANQLLTLDVSKNTAITGLWCGSNRFTSLDVSKNTALEKLYCNNNQLTTLDVSVNKALTTLNCGKNPLTTLDLSKNTKLTGLSINRSNIKGAGMDALIKSLPTNTTSTAYQLWVINNTNDDEYNVCTKAQVAALKAKGWTALYYDKKTKDWLKYEGSDKQLNYLVIWAKDGTKKNYALAERPKLTFTSSDLIITKNGQNTSYPLVDILRFTYESLMTGDVNCDGKVDIVDIVTTLNYIQGLSTNTFSFEAADVNGNGFIDFDDINIIINIILNKKENNPSNHEGTIDYNDFLGQMSDGYQKVDIIKCNNYTCYLSDALYIFRSKDKYICGYCKRSNI